MPMKFSEFPELPGHVQTVMSDDEEDEPSEGGTIGSASEFDGDLKDLPEYLLFGGRECRVKYEAAGDKGQFIRVCGRDRGSCTRMGHSQAREMERALEGYYEAVRSRSYVDGKHHTYRSLEEFQESEQVRKLQQKKELDEATKVLADLNQESPTSSENVEYEEAKGFPDGPFAPKPEGVESKGKTPRVPKEEGKPMLEDIDMGTPHDLQSSPVLKEVMKAGKLDEAMIGMMEYLAKTVTKLDSRLENLESDPREPGMVEKDASKTSQAKEAVVHGKTPKGHHYGPWYAVAKGRDDIQGVFESWSVVSPLVVGISGAIYQKFKTKEGAEHFMQEYERSESQRQCRVHIQDDRTSGTKKETERNLTGHSWYTVTNEVTKAAGMYQSWEDGEQHVNGVRGAKAKKFGSFEEAQIHVERWSSQNEEGYGKSRFPPTVEECIQEDKEEQPGGWEQNNYYLPSDVIGPDPSMEKDNQVFGIEIGGSESELRAALCPPGMSTDEARSLTNALVDVVALPGGYLGGSGGDEGNVNDMTLLGEAMEELVQQRRGGSGDGTARADLHWRSEKRTALRSVKSIGLLRKRIKVLLKLRTKIYNRIKQATMQACRRAGWTDQSRIHAWATSGYLTRLSNDSLEYYIALHQHLMELANTDPHTWGFTKMEVEHHVEELEVIRNTADSRLQALCGLYVYLRDGNKAGWQSNSLQAKRNMDMHSKINGGRSMDTDSTSELSHDGTGWSSETRGCPKCHTLLHSGGRTFCPWKNSSDEVAAKKGAEALRNLAMKGGGGYGKKEKGGKKGGSGDGDVDEKVH